MDKVYRLLAWMDINQAVDWLQDMTATQLTDRDLLQLCEAGQCYAYADVDGLTGFNFSNPDCQVAKGIHFVKNPMDAFASGWEPRTLFSEGEISGFGTGEWSGDLPVWKRGPIFKPSDIEALAAKMNGEDARATEIEGLRQELKCERDARKVIESELRERRAKDGSDGLENMRQMLSHTPKEFAAMQERAENAERLLAALDQQLTHLAEEKRVSDKLSMEMARQLRELSGQKPAASTETVVAGLTFPYATKELEAMRAAIAEHWEGYTLDKRQPTQKAVAFTLGELLGLPRQGNGDPARKAIVLASAIKPDTLPDA
ncbi:hypothetical protein [Aquipseudomonas alcaligenes]|uniref:Uncharacterized protein n=1 Tax=Aquipseudomonas alcaligenes TaxID=43263 RepID=A0AA42N2J7_AQUAC|nr:hypothetical protein [Pseudomonas alcaligenes]MDH1056348.1 hypothetical protein [Pseudomonas alcaligenes]